MRILKIDKDKADCQDQDETIKIVKEWVKEGQQPTGTDMNFKNPDLLAYRKLIPMEGTDKTILVKQGLVEGTMD